MEKGKVLKRSKQIKKISSAKKYKAVSEKKERKTPTKKEILQRIMKRLFEGGKPMEKIDKERKAKIEATKTLEQLFFHKGDKLYVDEKLIYV